MPAVKLKVVIFLGLGPCAEDEAVKWPAQYPGLWKGKILGHFGLNASSSKATPIYTIVSRGSALNAWLHPDPRDATRIVSGNIHMANMSTAGMFADGSFAYVNEPFKYISGDGDAPGREKWLNRFFINVKEEIMYMLSDTAPGDKPIEEVPTSPTTFDPVRIAEAFDADDFATLADAGAVAAEVMSKV
jgi:hypothetical protein